VNIQPVKTAIIGCGMISDAYLMTLTTKFKIIQLVGCCDLNSRKAEAAAAKYGIKAMTMEEIMEDASIELVIDLTAAPNHYQVNKKLLNAGKHVYTEKVMAATLEEAQELAAIANEKKLHLGAAPDTFLGSAIQTARYVVDSGMIGKISSCYGALSRDLGLSAGPSSFTIQAGCGIAYDVGIYYITALLSILGPVRSVSGIMDTKEKDRTYRHVEYFDEKFSIACENIMAGTLEFENGVVGNLLFDSNSIQIVPEKPALVIYGTMGMMYMNDPNLFGGEVKVIIKGNETPFIMQQAHPFSEEYRGLGAAEMAWAIRRGREHRASKEMACHALEVLQGIGISSQTKRHYSLTSKFEIPTPLARGYAGSTYMKGIEETVLAI
jgi:predicted dehydrogenase